ncbi:Protein ELYS like [Pseudolycoriella hygida]|uniref:Protein ELYS like n=1 Tax=Pseudolycoriella hygida TaxID=35572 RepID=A0A9Q0MMF1_9DIPT|nr:Protein ELYS like [Pseudolycoriella hygida]
MTKKMQNNFLEFGIRQKVKHAPSVLYGLENVQGNNALETNQQDTIGGIFHDGLYGWIVVGAHIEIVSLKNGDRIAEYTFGDKRFGNTFIAFVTEVKVDQINTKLLAIGVHSSSTTSCIYLFGVSDSRIIHTIEVEQRVTSCCFIDAQICVDCALNSFDGCIIVGTETGKVLIIDLFVESCIRVINGLEFFNNEPRLCRIVTLSSFRAVGVERFINDPNDTGFGVALKDVTKSGSVLSILCLSPLLIIAVGFEDGKMLLYDLCTLDAFHIAHPPGNDSPLEKLTFIEPADDPRACVYLWCFHSKNDTAIAVLHSLTYETKIVKPDGNGFVYKNFERCTPRLTMPIFEKHSKPISCQSITRFVVAEENFLTLCLLSWSSLSGTFVCIFDLNQWYKQQLPETCDWRSSPTFLAIFHLGKQQVLDVWMNVATVTPFSSLNRPEEHFYPSSLSFDCSVLTPIDSSKLHWLGLQNETLQHLSQSGPYAILEPNRCFAEMVRASLIPQFTEYSYDMNQSLVSNSRASDEGQHIVQLNISVQQKSKREFLLSIALEYNCINLLKKCANAWADGSHLTKNPSEGMSLSTLTDWVWKRATSIKECCNEMCVPLFDHSGSSIEPRSRKVLLSFSRQLKRLFQLMDMILTTHRQYIPGENTLRSQRNSICMASEYQEVLQWLLNMGLLPEVIANQSLQRYSDYRDSSFDDFQAIPYPYELLKNYYTTQRRKFGALNPDFLVPVTKSCRVLYIDSFIEHECNSAVLRSEWRKGFGDGLYPPASLQAMLRTLLVPDVPTERKYMLFVYLFMDLTTVLREERYSNVIKNLIKFPAVFKMDPGLIKITQAFWNLDHGEFDLAVDEIISPLAQDHNMSTWQRELLIGVLILNDVPHLALRVLHAPGAPISPSLEIRTLLANDLVADAFQVQRMKRNRDLLFEFFQGCHEQRKWHYLLNLSLNENEEECLGDFLRSIQSSIGENIHFIYLLRRCKYLEAVTFINDLHQNKKSGHFDLDTPNTILSTYRLTMAPSIRKFADAYYTRKDDINVQLNNPAKCPKPLSTHLSQGKLDQVGGVYQQSLIHTEQTSAKYWENQAKKMCGLAPSNVPFLHGLRVNTAQTIGFDKQVCHAEPFVPSSKRRFNNSFEDEVQAPVAKRQRTDCSDVNPSLLTSFKTSNATLRPSQSLAKCKEDSTEMDADIEMMETTLNTPVVQSHKNVKKTYSLLERIGTPQSILKSRSSYRGKSVSSIASRRSVDSDERSIRFTLPENIDESVEVIAASTPIVPTVFNFGISKRPSIHSVRTPSKHSLTEQTITKESEDSPLQTSGRKRMRSISPEESLNVTNCIDVSVNQPTYDVKSRQLFVSSDKSNDGDSDIVETESDNLSTSEKVLDEPSPVVHIDRTKEIMDRIISMESGFVSQNPTKEHMQPVERIIPIEVEPRSDTKTPDKLVTALVTHELFTPENKLKRRPSEGLSTSSSFLFTQKNVLTDSSEYQSPSYAEITFDDSAFVPPNILTSSESIEQSTSAATVDDAKEEDIVETVQIEDSSDSSVCDIIETTDTKSKVPQTSTPFVSRISKLSGFDTSDEMAHKKNILTDSTYKELSDRDRSVWDQSSMYKQRNILTDTTYKDDSKGSLEPSTYKDLRTSSAVGDGRNSIASEKDDDKPIVIDTADQASKVSESISPDLNEEYSSDIYDLCSEIDARLQEEEEDEEEYDVDDYESDTVDDVIDISSGSEDNSETPTKNENLTTGKLILPPCNTIGALSKVETKIDNPVDVSKCSDMSFVTATDTSSKNVSRLSTIDQIITDDVQLTDRDDIISIENDLADVNTEAVLSVPIEEFIGVEDDKDKLSEHQLTITYELQENVFTGDEEGATFDVLCNTQNDLISSDLNNAILHSANVDTMGETLTQIQPLQVTSETFANVTEDVINMNDAIIDSQVAILAESNCEQTLPVVGENLLQGVEVVDGTITSDETLLPLVKLVDTGDTLPAESLFADTTSDLNTGMILNTLPLQDSSEASQQPQETEVLGDVYDQDMTETTSGEMNKAIVYEQSELESQLAQDITAIDDSKTSAPVHATVEQLEALNIDEILESFIVPDAAHDSEVPNVTEISNDLIVPTVQEGLATLEVPHTMDVPRADEALSLIEIPNIPNEENSNAQEVSIVADISTAPHIANMSTIEKVATDVIDEKDDIHQGDNSPKPSTSGETSNNQTPTRFLRAKSPDATSAISSPMTRKRSGSLNSGKPISVAESTLNVSSYMTKAEPELKNLPEGNSERPIRSQRAKSEVKSIANDERTKSVLETLPEESTVRLTRRIRAKSEVKSTASNERAKSETLFEESSVRPMRTRRAKSEMKSPASDERAKPKLETLQEDSNVRPTRSQRAKSEVKSAAISEIVKSELENLPEENSVRPSRGQRAKSEVKSTAIDERAKSELKPLLEESNVRPTRSQRAKSEVKSTASDEKAKIKLETSHEDSNVRPTRSQRAKSEVKSSAIDERAKMESETLPAESSVRRARGQRAKSEVKLSAIDERAKSESETSPQKSSVRPTRGERAKSVTKTSDEKTLNKVKDPQITGSPITRSRARSIAEDDDTASIASGISSNSLPTTSKRTRSTRGNSQASDEGESSSVKSSKRSRVKPKVLPAIIEDLPQEHEAENEPMTRAQRAFMKKAAETAKMVPPPIPVIQRKRKADTGGNENDDDDTSDTGSVESSKTSASVRSRKSLDPSTPVRKSKRLREKSIDESIASKDSDSESVASVSSKKSTDALSPIRQSSRLREITIASKASDTESVVSAGKSIRSRRGSTASKK